MNNECQNCGGVITRNEFHVDRWLCVECQRSPAVQLRALLNVSRKNDVEFEEAWSLALSRVRWPHDTVHRREWKTVLEAPSAREAWRTAYAGQFRATAYIARERGRMEPGLLLLGTSGHAPAMAA